ncbi:MAG: exonuclease SbcCD subunit D C-terminal domain-containing protein [Gammaproteobacteria bacterium]
MLRIFHTADWHLGHTLHNMPRDFEHQQFLDWLLQQLVLQQADALLVAGDIFDSANPPASAQARLYRFLVRAKQRLPQLDIIVIGGNHDSASRLDAPRPMLDSLGIQVVGGLPRVDDGRINWDRLCIPVKGRDGAVKAWCGAMPFLRQADLPDSGDRIGDPLIAGVRSLYGELIERLRQKADAGHKLILTGHCYMVGTRLSELSERKILGGNQHALPADIFPAAVDYVALGHLHLAQQVGDSRVRYSGSPIPLSFDETGYRHQVLQVDLVENADTVVTSIPVPRAVELLRIPVNKHAPMAEVLEDLATRTFDASLAKDRQPFLECRILLDKPEPGLRQGIEEAVKDKAVRLIKISTRYTGSGSSLADIEAQERLEDLDEEQVFQRCYQQMHGVNAPPALIELFHQLLESVREAEV